MGVSAVTNMCSHLQNAARGKLGLTSVPNIKYNLRLALAMHRAGFISSVTRGGPSPPPLEALSTYQPEVVTHANVSSRRLWLGLKYWDNRPVMSNVKSVTTPKRPITLSVREMESVVRGFKRGYVPGLELGECLFVSTDHGVLEAREAIAKNSGGLVLARVS
ncbi:mitochondrial 37S ribosomal protein S8 [Zalerion maritima]|uniref:Mitochondrial 37S ribosomal protein S8 n=1 Tax=Zalerion maritima TaxID=339359 RepID=A0AAD5RI02_9PEZI|nr:mitochondrial 37S ribosomal protein S8 [Zalerion maritima]